LKKFPFIVIVTGLSGSGKTVALRALEDSGFFCVDNLPIALIEAFVTEVSSSSEIRDIGIGIDIREKGFLTDVENVIKALKNQFNTEVLFLEAEQDVLLRRFKETRRPHPLQGNIEDAIKIEKKRLLVLREIADRIIDTSSFTPHQLRRLITCQFNLAQDKDFMTVVLISFGFKFGAPQNLDLLFDVRFLPNPHFIPELKNLKGTDKKVADFVLKNNLANVYIKKIKNLIDFLIPNYIKEGKTYLTIGIGCTGGNHRSPAIVEKLAKIIKKHPVKLNIVHRDITV
jgi:UPF0042 nucleotide-binding protein